MKDLILKEDGSWKMGDGSWELEVGRWEMEDGRWKMEDGRWKMEDGRWKMGVGIKNLKVFIDIVVDIDIVIALVLCKFA